MQILRAMALVATGIWAAIGAGGATPDAVRDSVVKIFAPQSPPNMFRPWEVRPAQEATGSGVLIEGGRILTNAHVVKDAQQIYVQPNRSSERLDAKVEYFAEDCDLATLKVEDAESLAKLTPVALSEELPRLQVKVEVLGYPTGGDTLSVTEGVVSRIEYAPYYGHTALLRIQVDAAINPGNSGGPVVVDGKLVGVVFSRLSQSDNIGYVIPTQVVRHFLEDFDKDGDFDGFPSIDLNLSSLENPAMRDFLKLKREQTGVVVHRVNGPNLQDLLKPWDVITACDGVSIDNLGMVTIENDLRVAWPYLLSRKAAGTSITLSVIRQGGAAIDVEAPTSAQPDRIVQHMKQQRPTYFMYGGIVFSPVTQELITQGGPRFMAYLGAEGRIIPRRINEYRPEPGMELVVCTADILPNKVNKGYKVDPLSVCTHVNDEPVKNLAHLIQLVKKNQDQPFIVFRFEDEFVEKVVLNPKDVAEAQMQILQQNQISSACSPDLKDLWP